MKISQVLLMCLFMTMRIVSSEKRQLVDFTVLTDENEEIQVNLIPIESFLANKYLPVWIPNENDPTKLEPLKEIMENIGHFTMYWDPLTCAAAVNYHNQDEFDAYIGHHYVIRKGYYDAHWKYLKSSKDTVTTMQKHDKNRLSEQMRYHQAGEVPYQLIQSRVDFPDRVYVEILVIVNDDITAQLDHNYAEVVRYVLGQFNMIDMLYSKIEIPNIRINLAGIIIGTSSNPAHVIHSSCYHRHKSNRDGVYINPVCADGAIRENLQTYNNVPLQSYDIVVFLTRHDLISREEVASNSGKIVFEDEYILGICYHLDRNNMYRVSLMDINVILVGTNDIYAHFPTTAHEIAHSLGVPHDEGPVWKEDGTCDAHLMKDDVTYCNKCLQFGGSTPQHLKNFFGSQCGCIYRNKPTSLNHPQRPQLFWSENEQCRCLGYAGSQKAMNVICELRLRCVNDNDRISRTGLYMNGTPCDRKKTGSNVCWNSKCLPVVEEHEM